MNIVTAHHPKLFELTEFLDEFYRKQGHPLPLGMVRNMAVGLVEQLWMFTTHYAPAGDIGRHTDATIARVVGWEGEPQLLIEKLVELRLLDRHDEHRLIVHNWGRHATTACHQHVADEGISFADGSPSSRKPRRNSPEGTRLRQAQAAEPQQEEHATAEHATADRVAAEQATIERQPVDHAAIRRTAAKLGIPDALIDLPVRPGSDEPTPADAASALEPGEDRCEDIEPDEIEEDDLDDETKAAHEETYRKAREYLAGLQKAMGS